MKILVLVLFVFLSHRCLAESEEFRKSPHKKGTVSSINVGGRYSSLSEFRGVIFYRDFQIDPVLSAFFFDDKLEFSGDSLGYRDFVMEDWMRLRTRVHVISDQPLFPAYDSVKVNFGRKTTFEWSNGMEFFFPGYNENYLGELDVEWSKDFVAHNGNYVEATAKLKLFHFRALEMLLEPNFVTALGWGDSAHNQFYYGPSMSKDGLTNVSYGLWLAFPEEADRYFPIIQLTHFQTIGDFSRGEFAINRNEGWVFSLIASVGLL